MQRRWAAVFFTVGVMSVHVAGCGDDDAGAGTGSGTGGSAHGSGHGTGGRTGGGSGGHLAGAVDAGGGGEATPTAMVRVANIVPGVTFDAWGPGADAKPVRLAQGIEYAAISDYIDVPLNMLTNVPIFTLWRSGDMPPADKTFSMLLDDTHERVRIEVLELDGADQRATIILEPTDPDGVSPLEYETLDETEAERGDSSKVNLHIAYHLFDITGGAVISAGVVGQPCLIDGSTSVAQVFSVDPGSFDFAVYDLQAGGTCGDTDPLAKLKIDAQAGDNVLVVMYLDANDVKLMTAPIE